MTSDEPLSLYSILRNAAWKAREDELRDSNVLSLGDCIVKLEGMDLKDKGVRFDFEYLMPTHLMSYRGYYNELSLGYTEINSGSQALNASQLLEEMKSAVEKTFQGYKGGDFVMGRTTPVWVANYGNSGDTAIVDIVCDDCDVYIITRNREAEALRRSNVNE